MFRHLKSTFDETKNTIKRELNSGDLENTSSQDEDDEHELSGHSQNNLNFKSAEKVQEFLMEVI